MSLYDGIKDVAKVVQQADNIELYRQLLDLGAQALDMQAEIARLKEELCELKKEKYTEDLIIRHEEPFVTLRNDEREIRYCAICWAKEKKLLQMTKYINYSEHKLKCISCGNRCYDSND